ncbi:hypothetical protein ACC699_13660 [Rhizobium ruizarguesonis]
MTSILIDRTDGLSSATAIKGPCKAATTANISLYGEQTIDGVAIVTGDRVLVKSQTAGYENGIYVCDTGQWRRSKDFNRTNDVVKGTTVFVTDGTVSAETLWTVTTSNPVAVGTTSISFSSGIIAPPVNSVNTAAIQDGAVTTPKIADGAVTTIKIADDAVTAAKIAPGTIIQTVLTRTALKALNTTKATTAYLKEAGREGIFKWTTGNFSSQITADTAEGIYLKADAIASSAGAWVRVFIRVADIRWFGALGDGTTNDTTAVTAALAAGIPLTGASKTYVVSGDISIPASTYLEDAAFKQLTPNNANRKTLYANGVSNVTLRRVTVDRNGNGTYGSLNGAGGIWISGGSGHYLEDCEVYGSDIGSGIVISGAADFQVVRPHVHDILYVSASLPADDQAQGLWLSACSDFSVLEPKIHHIGGIVGGSFRRAFGRMMPIGLGCAYFRIIGGEMYDGDVGIDLTGSKGNVNFVVMGVTVRDVETWGIKLANYNRYGTVMGCNVHRAGSAAFVGSGPTVDVDPDTPVPASLPQHVTFTACGAWDTGNGNTGRGTSQPAGFLITPGAAPSYQDYPRGYRMIGCTAYDNQTVKTQYNGFRCETTFGGQPLNEVINCKSGGYAVGGQHVATVPYPACSIYRSSTQSIPNNSTTVVDWTSEEFDGASMHSTSSNTDTIFAQEAGWYRIEAEVTFASNGTGLRSLSITIGGVTRTRLYDSQPGSTVNDTTCRLSGLVYISDITGGIKLQAYQNSGGALNIQANANMTVSKAMPNN